ncbi:RNA-binding domain-containing protein [Sistotremastrum niveocremeum HHB9708]|uniref:RNA-binding domain-containing protein n=1 Tax=Sistotremastrum niveocremeum HHB9708 TaxID=1314777 RepID=A0A164TRC6_9AGAM|nr:RNA-binding domain-containing protein [Sistotremastrum niveocremeum HHB9708]
MAPKKAGKKMALSAFLEEQAFGSWADEMDALPSAPAAKDDNDASHPGERNFDRRDRDYGERSHQPPREELPLPTQPPYTAFVGNLSFDCTEGDLEGFFGPKTKSAKIIRDRDEKPKGFGYVEFEDLEALKEGLQKSGSTFSGRNVRVSVAEPPKERIGGGGFDDEKFAGNWRRDGPLPDRQSSRSRFDEDRGSRFGQGREGREPLPPSVAETVDDWRGNRPGPLPPREDHARPPRRSGFSTPVGEHSAADAEEVWTIGSKFKPSPTNSESGSRSRFGSMRSDMGPPPPRESAAPESDWRSRPTRQDSFDRSSSTPPTPQLNRRRLELLPRSTAGSTVASPLSSPKAAHATARPNPFGAAKPVDVSAKEAAVAERLEKEREELHNAALARHPLSRNTSNAARERGSASPIPPSPGSNPAVSLSPSAPASPKPAHSAVVRPAFSFAKAAGSNGPKAPPKAASASETAPPPAQAGETVEKTSEDN